MFLNLKAQCSTERHCFSKVVFDLNDQSLLSHLTDSQTGFWRHQKTRSSNRILMADRGFKWCIRVFDFKRNSARLPVRNGAWSTDVSLQWQICVKVKSEAEKEREWRASCRSVFVFVLPLDSEFSSRETSRQANSSRENLKRSKMKTNHLTTRK